MKTNFVKSVFVIIMTFILIIVVQSKTKAAIYENTFEYELKSGVAVIKKYIGSSTQVAIPREIVGATRMLIKKGAFDSNNLKKVVILNNVKTIEKEAFSENTKTVIYGNKDSAAEKYAKENNMEFRIYCDINGDNDVSATDSLKVKRHIVELSGYMLNEDEQIRADLNCDDKVTTTDLLITKRIVVGLDETEEPEELEEADEPESHENQQTSIIPVELDKLKWNKDYYYGTRDEEEWKINKGGVKRECMAINMEWRNIKDKSSR